MKITIKETGETKKLTIIGNNGCEWTADLITASEFWDIEKEKYIMEQKTFDWWAEYITDHENDEKEITEIAEELNINESEIYERINESMNCELGDEHAIKQNILSEIKKEVLA